MKPNFVNMLSYVRQWLGVAIGVRMADILIEASPVDRYSDRTGIMLNSNRVRHFWPVRNLTLHADFPHPSTWAALKRGHHHRLPIQKRSPLNQEVFMIPIFLKKDRRQGFERRRYYLTIHFPERRSGGLRRIAIDRRSAMLTRRKDGAERRQYAKSNI